MKNDSDFWKSKKLRLLTTKIGSGSTPKGGSTVYVKKGVFLIRSQNIYNDYFKKEGLVCIEDDIAEKMKGVEVKENDVLINITGDSVARTFIISKEFLPARVNQHVSIIRTNSELIHSYLYYYLIEKNMQELLLSLASVGGTRNAITKDMLEDLEIRYPSIEIQNKIVIHLNSIKSKIENLKKINHVLENIIQTIFKSWFIDFDGQSEFEDSELGPIPKGWLISKIGEIADSISETHPMNKDQLIFLNTSDIHLGQILNDKYTQTKNFPGQAKKSIKKNDILLSEIRPENARFAYVDIDVYDYVVSTKLMVIRTKEQILSKYLYYFLTSNEITNLLQHAAESRSGTFPQITFNEVASIEIILPPKKNIELYNKTINQIMAKISHNLTYIKNLSKIRDSLLPKLLSGDIQP